MPNARRKEVRKTQLWQDKNDLESFINITHIEKKMTKKEMEKVIVNLKEENQSLQDKNTDQANWIKELKNDLERDNRIMDYIIWVSGESLSKEREKNA